MKRTLKKLERFVDVREPETRILERALTLTFKDGLELYLVEKRARVSPAQIRNFEANAKAFWYPRFGERKLADLEPDDFRTYFADRVSGKIPSGGRRRPRRAVTGVTVNNERAKLMMLFRWLQLNGLALRNPVAAVARYREERKHPRVLEEWEQEALLRACQEPVEKNVTGEREHTYGGEGRHWRTWTQRWNPPRRLYPLVVVALETGLRKRTLCGLRWTHLDLDAGKLRIGGALMKYGELFEAPMSDRCLETLVEWRRRLLETKGTEAIQPEASVFGLDEESSVFKGFATAVERAKIGYASFHSLRRTFIVNCRRRGVPLEVCMRLSDHRDLRTVLKHYRGVSEEELLQALGRKRKGPARDKA